MILLRKIGVVRITSILLLFFIIGCKTGTEPDPGPDPGPGTGELVVHVGEWLRSLVSRDLHYTELGAIYAIEDKPDGRLVEIPLAPGNAVFHETVSSAIAQTLVVYDSTAYWHDQSNFYWVPLGGGTIQSVSTGSYTIQQYPLPSPPYIYFDEFITDRLYRILPSGGALEEMDQFTLGGYRGIARDQNSLYWIGATDGTYLKSMPAAGGIQTTLLSGNEVYLPHKMKSVPDGSGGTVLYWMDILQSGNIVIRKFPVPAGPVTSIINAADLLNFEVSTDALYWYTASYIGRFDLTSQQFSYPVQIKGLSIQGMCTAGNYIYYTISDGYVYRVQR